MKEQVHGPQCAYSVCAYACKHANTCAHPSSRMPACTPNFKNMACSTFHGHSMIEMPSVGGTWGRGC